MNIFSNIGKKEKFGLAIAAVVAMLAFSDRLIVMPISSCFKKINFEIKTNERHLAQALVNVNQRDSINKEYKKYLPYVKPTASEGEEVAKLLESVESLGRSAGVSINDVKPQPPKDIDIYRYYMIEVEAEGTMDTLMSFLHQLGSSKELFRAGKVYITVKDKDSSTAKASILVTKVVIP